MAYMSTVGRDEETIRQYIKKHEKEDKRLDRQLSLFDLERIINALSGSQFKPPALSEVYDL